MTIDKKTFPFSISDTFTAILEHEAFKVVTSTDEDMVLNFRDPAYSAERGGFHPVEIRISGAGQIQYITDFAFVGQPGCVEFAKEIDFDMSLGLFQHFGREFPINAGRELYAVWQENFVSYYQAGVYQVTVGEG